MANDADDPIFLPLHRHRAIHRIADVEQRQRHLLVQQHDRVAVLQFLREEEPTIAQVQGTVDKAVRPQQLQASRCAAVDVRGQAHLIPDAREGVAAYVAADILHSAVKAFAQLLQPLVGQRLLSIAVAAVLCRLIRRSFDQILQLVAHAVDRKHAVAERCGQQHKERQLPPWFLLHKRSSGVS